MLIPSPEKIKQARTEAGLTQTQASDLIFKSCRAWQQYEKGDREMDFAYWELFLLKSGSHPDLIINKRDA